MGRISRGDLHKKMRKGLDESEIEQLIFDLNLDGEEIKGETKSEKLRELIKFCQRRKMGSALVTTIRASWPDLIDKAIQDIEEGSIQDQWDDLSPHVQVSILGAVIVVVAGLGWLVGTVGPIAPTQTSGSPTGIFHIPVPPGPSDKAVGTSTYKGAMPPFLPTIAPRATIDPIANQNDMRCPSPASALSDEALLTPIAVAAITFTMGDKQSPYTGEREEHLVSVDAFEIDRYEVTNWQYSRFINETHHRPPEYWPNGKMPLDEAYHPVKEVTWQDAVAYCKWDGKRLPTEAEWELACRGPQGWQLPWGPAWDEGKSNVLSSGCGASLRVGSYQLQESNSYYGVADMIGNVHEWVSTIYQPYPYRKDALHENDQNTDAYRVTRGSSWQAPITARCTVRVETDPRFPVADVGFRCARSLP